MRIAFASCFFNRVFADQPVWDWIAAQVPDRLVLLGDSTYHDLKTALHPEQMSDDEFAQHLFARWRATLAQPQFAALVRALPAGAVDAIWDDHDFLWNDALGHELRHLHQEKIRISTAFLRVVRAALHAQLPPAGQPGSFPTHYQDAEFWDLGEPPLATPSVALAPDLWLHLTDGRTHRTRTWGKAEAKRTILGAVQRRRIETAITAAPADAVHLFASGSTVAGYQRYGVDLTWLKALAAQHRMLVLSGDIHRNDLDGFVAGTFPLHEATSSGAAVKDAVIIGSPLKNYGLVDIDAANVAIRLFKDSQVEQQRTLDRLTWLPV